MGLSSTKNKVYGLTDRIEFGQFKGETIEDLINDDYGYLIKYYAHKGNIVISDEVLTKIDAKDQFKDVPACFDKIYYDRIKDFIESNPGKVYIVADLTNDTKKFHAHVKYYIDSKYGNDNYTDCCFNDDYSRLKIFDKI